MHKRVWIKLNLNLEKYMRSGEETINARLNYIRTTNEHISQDLIFLEMIPGALEQNKLRLIGLIFKFRILEGII